MFGYKVPAPDEAMLISGGSHAEGVPFRVVVGKGCFVPPFFRKVQFLTLRMQESQVQEQCTSKQGIQLQVQAVIAFKIGNDTESIVNAGQRFLSDQSQMTTLTGRIFAGHLRSIVGSMSVEEIIQERQKLAEEVLDGSKTEMARIGLVVDSLQIQSIDDMKSGYIDAMGQAQRAEVARQAAVAQASASQATQIAQAQAQQAAAEAQQLSQQAQSNFAADTAKIAAQNQAAIETAQAQSAAAIGAAQAQSQSAVGTAQAKAQAEVGTAQATLRAQVDKAAAEAAQAGPLAQARQSQQVAVEQTKLAEQSAKLREQQLLTEVVKPAEAQAEMVRITAKAEAERQTITAQAIAASDRITLDQQLITLLPQIVDAAAGGLAGSNLTILNGADGVGEMVAQIISQGTTILGALRAAAKAGDDTGK